ncbi:MAG TPA: class I SAM-dependent methyltransferase [Solirubrobacteraceae bacterium]
MGRLFGLDPPPARASRVLELGCGDGGNALSIAAALPDAEVLGVDASAAAIERGSKIASAAGIENVRLRCATFESLTDEVGTFDYIVSHGVYSWVLPVARGALLDCVKRSMSAKGIAFVSYNAYPGSYLRDMARDILGYHVRDIEDPQRKLAAAQELMQTIVAIEEPSPFARVLREHMERMLSYSDALLFHDDLAEVSTPFYFHEFVAHATRHGLRFLSEAELSESRMRDLPDSAGRLIAGLPDDVVAREQYLDFFKNRMFRQTLVCHAEIPLDHALRDREIERLWVSSSARPQQEESDPQQSDGRAREDADADGIAGDGGEAAVERAGQTFATPEGFTVTSSEPLVLAALNALADCWPAALSFGELLDCAVERSGVDVSRGIALGRLRAVLLEAYLARIVQLLGCASPVAARASERPLASPLARAQQAAGLPALSSLLHANVRLEGELEPRLLPLLDGTRDGAELAHALGVSREQVAESLARLASLGLLALG